MQILTLDQIKEAVSIPEILKAIEEGFILYSEGKTVIPPIGSLHFENPPGDCHIKYGYVKAGKHYVIKIASGFYKNLNLGIPTNNGMVLLFDKHTGQPVCLFQDEGYLTILRTAAAGSIAAKYLAPKNITTIGIAGTGTQAHYQLQFLQYATDCRKVILWGRDKEKAKKFVQNPELNAWNFEIADKLQDLATKCQLIVTTTSSTKPLLLADQIKPGTHITAVGADDIGKQELDENLFTLANKIIVDSRSQCSAFGDSSYALKKNLIHPDRLIELGEVLTSPSLGRISDREITICDLTGIAIQDLQIAESIFYNHRSF